MNSQLNPSTYRKFNNLLSSGAVTVTGPGQPRILKPTRLGTPGGGSQNVSASSQQNMDTDNGVRCYICDELLLANQTQTSLTEMCTTHTSTKFPNKLAQLVGEAFLVIVCKEDFVCSRCTNLVNYYDRLENDVERVKSNLLNLLNKKYGINEDSGGSHADAASPPLKMQKLAGNAANRSLEESAGDVRQRKLVQQGTPGKLLDYQQQYQSHANPIPPLSSVATTEGNLATRSNCRRHTDAGAAQGNQDLQVHLVRLQDLRHASVQHTL